MVQNQPWLQPNSRSSRFQQLPRVFRGSFAMLFWGARSRDTIVKITLGCKGRLRQLFIRFEWSTNDPSYGVAVCLPEGTAHVKTHFTVLISDLFSLPVSTAINVSRPEDRGNKSTKYGHWLFLPERSLGSFLQSQCILEPRVYGDNRWLFVGEYLLFLPRNSPIHREMPIELTLEKLL